MAVLASWLAGILSRALSFSSVAHVPGLWPLHAAIHVAIVEYATLDSILCVIYFVVRIPVVGLPFDSL